MKLNDNVAFLNILGKFTTEHSLRQHGLKAHSIHYRCAHCAAAFSLGDLHGFKFHMFKHYYQGPLKCIQCGFTCYDRSVFIHHTETGQFVHDNLCSQCNEPMEKYDLYLLHIAENHNGQLKYKCKRCSELFDDLKNLDTHRRMVHVKKRIYPKKIKKPRQPPKERICQICGMTVRNMTSHNDYYHKKDEILCKDCGKLCMNHKKLQDHIYQYHTEGTCPECGVVMLKPALNRHMQRKHVPNSERKHKCEWVVFYFSSLVFLFFFCKN